MTKQCNAASTINSKNVKILKDLNPKNMYLSFNTFTGLSQWAGGPQFLADQLTLSQPGGGRGTLLCAPRTFRPCDGPEM